MSDYAKRIMCLNDISAVGRCSLSVISPVMTALGCECAMLPTALLSTHTGGFGDVAAHASGDFLRRALLHFKREDIRFHAVYSGYLGTVQAAEAVSLALIQYDDALKVVDPVCADNGRVYTSISGELLRNIKKLCAAADVITPNVTEAKILVSRQYDEGLLDDEQVKELCGALAERYSPRGVITSVQTLGGWCNAVYDSGSVSLCRYEKRPRSFPGSGDLFAAVLTSLLVRGDMSLKEAARYATDIACEAIARTGELDRETRYGLCIERIMPLLCSLKEELDEN